MKNYVSTIVLVLSVILLAGCGSSATTPPVPPTNTAVSSTVTPAPLTAERLVEECIQAMGGMEKIDALETMRTVQHWPDHGLIRYEIKRPNLVKMGDNLVFDGERAAWLNKTNADGTPELVPAEEWKDFEMDIGWFIPAFFDYPAEYLGTEVVDNIETYILQVTLPLGAVLTYNLDAETYLVYRTFSDVVIGDKEFHMERTYSDYRLHDGILYPHAFTYASRDGTEVLTATMETLEFNVPFENEYFSVPNPPHLTSLTGAYLGQNPPGALPVRFTPDILMPDGSWWWISPPKFSPDGREMVFTKYIYQDTKHQIYAMQRMANDEWTLPQEVPFGAKSGEDEDCHATFSIDGSKLFFLSDRSGKRFFFVTKDDDHWSDPVPVDIPSLSGGVGNQFSITRDGTIYFEMSESVTYDVPYDLYRSRLVNGEYGEPENLGAAINTDEYYEYAPFIDPDEDYLIFVSDRPGGFGGNDLYISFQNPDGSWTEPRNMGEAINSDAGDTIPYVSPDGEYFFFITRRAGDQGYYNPYWVDAQIIEDFRPSASLDNPGGGVIAFASGRDGRLVADGK